MKLRRLLIAILCLTVLLTGCTTMKPVDLVADKPITSALAPKDYVKVWMKDGRVLEFQLTAVETDALVSGTQRVSIKDVERIERQGFSAARTTLLVLGIGAAVILGLAIDASHHVCALGCR